MFKHDTSQTTLTFSLSCTTSEINCVFSFSPIVPTAADMVTVLGHPAVHTPGHSNVSEQAEHPPPADDGGLVARGSASGRLLPPPSPDTVVSSPYLVTRSHSICGCSNFPLDLCMYIVGQCGLITCSPVCPYCFLEK